MTSLLNIVRINPSYKFVGQAALKSMVFSLNASISALCASEVRRKFQGELVEVGPVDVSPLIAKYGNTLDNRNEQDEAARGAEHQDQQREEQGFEAALPPLELAGKLKVVRDWCAEHLDANARLMRNPLDPKGGVYKHQADVARPLEAAFMEQLGRAPRVNEGMLRAQAEALGISFEDALRVTKKRAEQQNKFVADHKDDILGMLQTLSASGTDGKLLDTSDAEDVETSLPPMNRAKLFVAADRGLFFAYDNALGMMLRGHPDGAPNRRLVHGTRVEVHTEFGRLMKLPDFRDSIDEAVRRGATWPVLTELPVLPVEAKKVA